MTAVSELPEPSPPNGKEVIVPASRSAWREWLDAHPDRVEGIWVVYRKPSSDLEGPTYEDLVEESLCFGWIDSVQKGVDDDRSIQWYSPRRKGGIWSALNKQRIERLTEAGLMTERGQAVINAAKADGSWSSYDDVEALVIHPDVKAALAEAPAAQVAFEALSPSSRKQLLWQVYSAKRPETRANRIAAMIRLLSEGE